MMERDSGNKLGKYNLPPLNVPSSTANHCYIRDDEETQRGELMLNEPINSLTGQGKWHVACSR